MLAKFSFLIYLPSAQILVGVPANILLIYLTLFRTPEAFRKYARVLFVGGVSDLIGALMQPVLVARSLTSGGFAILQFHGLCTLHSVESCWAGMGKNSSQNILLVWFIRCSQVEFVAGLLETLLTINDSLICTLLLFRLLTLIDKTPTHKMTMVFIFIIIIPNLPLSFGYYAVMRKFRYFSGEILDIRLGELLTSTEYCGVINLSDILSIVVVVWTCIALSLFFNSALFIRWKLIRVLENSKVLCIMSTASRRLHLMFIKVSRSIIDMDIQFKSITDAKCPIAHSHLFPNRISNLYNGSSPNHQLYRPSVRNSSGSIYESARITASFR
ncbi:hypothetical protein PRIPAC_97037 [Pristionchus pacificus]|uniref:G protein-coupled receptor n=1 Tax=Pristionchus pacificus TaxID=54126 RepID=A0A2A6CV33_PRIPA|nr:hypothetical protein PRIPAC_97037 [Pristionchus pacificus]|eukprot:PDM81903.1 G protein-coupled receptor [Pristionchus pacificus]